jgi:hypothetical protein
MLKTQHFLDSQLTYGDEIVSLMHRESFIPFPPGRFLVVTYVRGRVNPRAIVLLEGLGNLKKEFNYLTGS